MHQGSTVVLSIAGFDPSAGAGVLADVKTFEANGVYGMAVVAALTWQNDTEFDRVQWVPVHDIKEQVLVLLRRFTITHIKIGLVESVSVLQEIVDFLHSVIQNPVIVYDPILRASAGYEFHNSPVLMTQALSGICCITPNLPEAALIWNTHELNEVLEGVSETTNVYLKGGHADGDTVTDLLYTADHTYAFPNDRIQNGAKHGSGCVLSAALTAQLAKGHDIATASELANVYTHRFLGSTTTLLGIHQRFDA